MTRSIASSSAWSSIDLRAGARGEQRGLVEHVGQVGAGEAGGAAGDGVQVDVGRHRLALGVHLRGSARGPCRSGGVDGDLPVEAARAQQRGVEDVGPVGRRDEDDVRLDVEAVHLDEHLVERLLALVVPAAHAGAAVPADGVDLVDEDDRRGVLLGLVEQVADAAGADADEHLDEVRAGDRVERHARLAGDRAGQQRLAGAGRAVQQHALGDLGADGLELGRLGEELLDLLELLDRLVDTRDVGERDLRGLLADQLGLGLAEAHDPRAAALHAGHQEPEEAQDDDERQHERRAGWPTTRSAGRRRCSPPSGSASAIGGRRRTRPAARRSRTGRSLPRLSSPLTKSSVSVRSTRWSPSMILACSTLPSASSVEAVGGVDLAGCSGPRAWRRRCTAGSRRRRSRWMGPRASRLRFMGDGAQRPVIPPGRGAGVPRSYTEDLGGPRRVRPGRSSPRSRPQSPDQAP